MKVGDLLESPYLHDEELGFQSLGKISNSQLARAYTHIGTTRGNLEVYENNSGGFIAGFKKADYLAMVVSLSCRKTAYPVEPKGIDGYQQVSMVNVATEFAERGLTKEVYNQIAKHTPLVSDHEQYLAAQGLWKSLARDSDIKVYVFRGGHYMRYDGENISDKTIWGNTTVHRTILLVATDKNL